MVYDFIVNEKLRIKNWCFLINKSDFKLTLSGVTNLFDTPHKDHFLSYHIINLLFINRGILKFDLYLNDIKVWSKPYVAFLEIQFWMWEIWCTSKSESLISKDLKPWWIQTSSSKPTCGTWYYSYLQFKNGITCLFKPGQYAIVIVS